MMLSDLGFYLIFGGAILTVILFMYEANKYDKIMRELEEEQERRRKRREQQ